MKNIFSFIACIIIGIVLLQYRVSYPGIQSDKPLKVTTWDAFGYYLYLPSICIYHDFKELNWIPEIDKKYSVSGGGGYPAEKAKNGNYVFKYLGGVAVMQIPFFLIGHFIAKHAGYPPDGFSPPYQYALAFGVLFYCLLAIFLLRKILLYYFSDFTTAITLMLVCLATNFIQYAAIDNGQSHAYIFPLYALVLYTTLQWHRKPGIVWASLTGYIIGLATISRPTEAIMLLIPLLWNTHTLEAAKEKWRLARQNKIHLGWAAIFGLVGILPQLIYWKLAAGSFIYDVGSKWDFLNPHFRVLFGWEKGWFIYTPVTVLFVAGLFFMKRYPFRKSVLWFCLLNIYIVIAWHDWRYGGSYSTRALMQSYPVFALPLAAFIEKVRLNKWRIALYVVSAYLVLVNLFQVTQYSSTVLHYNDMNRRYYARIYLNPNPSPVDMSLLDSNEVLNNESGYHQTALAKADSAFYIRFTAPSQGILMQTSLALNTPPQAATDTWIKVEAHINAPGYLWESYLNAELKAGDSIKHAGVRLLSPISKNEATNTYMFYMSVPPYFEHGSLKLYLSTPFNFEGNVKQIVITELEK